MTNAGTPYLIEGNTGPGLSWDVNNKADVFKSKKLIRGIVDQLAVTRAKQKVDKFGVIVKMDHHPATLTSLRSVTNTVTI